MVERLVVIVLYCSSQLEVGSSVPQANRLLAMQLCVACSVSHRSCETVCTPGKPDKAQICVVPQSAHNLDKFCSNSTLSSFAKVLT